MKFKHTRRLKWVLQKASKAQANQSNQQQSLLAANLLENVNEVKRLLGHSTDLVIRDVYIGKNHRLKASIIYTDGLVDSEAIRDLMGSLHTSVPQDIEANSQRSIQQSVVDVLKHECLSAENVESIHDFDSLFSSVLSGDTIILIDGHQHGLAVSTKGGEQRAITEPSTEKVIRGPQEAFTENIRTNTSLIRRKIENPNLWIESRKIGRTTKTNVAIMYIHGVANDQVVQEVRQRLDQVDIDNVLESVYIEELIQDETYTPFPTVYNSERPDVIASKLLEGRIAILVNGTPFVLTTPALFIEFFQVNEDYYQRSTIGIFIRLLRLVAFFAALLAPSIYIAVSTFHQEMIPTPLLISLAAQREGIPFPAFVEAVIMETTFEILREAGTRLPKAAGQAVSIVGTFVIGIAAVEAGLVSAAMVIVVSLTAISSFVIPSYDIGISIRLLRFFMMVLAATFGLFGVVVGLITLILHLASLRSFGIPYMVPFGPFIMTNKSDPIYDETWWDLFSMKKMVKKDKPYHSQKLNR